MKDTISEETRKEWFGYKSSLEKRDLAKKQELRDQYTRYLSLANKIAASLYQDFFVQHVYLIGSLLDFDWFHKSSDIDIAVEGLNPTLYFKAFIEVEKITKGIPFHLIDMNTIPVTFKTKIVSKGKLL